MVEIREVQFQSHGDIRGQLIALEENKEIPFTVRRVYYIFDTVYGVRRGFHAHKELRQLLFCPCGSCKLHLDTGRKQYELKLNSPDKGVILSGLVWREMYDFTPGAVLAVLASDIYRPEDYIRDYDEFLKCVKGAEV